MAGHYFDYRIYILPILEYCSTCWLPNKTQGKQLESIQKRMTAMVCRRLGMDDLPYNIQLRLLSWKSLKHRRLLLLMRQFKSEMDSNSLTDDITILTNARRGINLTCNYPRLIKFHRSNTFS